MIDDQRLSPGRGRARARVRVIAAVIVVVGLIGLLFGPRVDADVARPWQWLFVIGTFVLLIGEIFTGGFFVLPFALGAGVAAVMSLVGVGPAATIPVFVVVSAISLWGLREYGRIGDDDPARVGANRYVGGKGVVTKPVTFVSGVGRVRVGTEDWQAVTDGAAPIEINSTVRVVEVRGTHLVVEATG